MKTAPSHHIFELLQFLWVLCHSLPLAQVFDSKIDLAGCLDVASHHRQLQLFKKSNRFEQLNFLRRFGVALGV
eukprot:CAMPEP_0204254010 /NCGR_PEP_ID=MMETSP0468-20130131/2282_1 /ASSEMBLY_ACC=CAM_ASM_000383 /TAXON_ID=2969 /ORGANISM="Oxyrrhis marina" /LENGTH=72 /DNA_ID=CAMNT_0051227693 /DNA_START=340 /DNA_END=558 /DNA_ORIENTATION=+